MLYIMLPWILTSNDPLKSYYSALLTMTMNISAIQIKQNSFNGNVKFTIQNFICVNIE